MCLDGAMFSLPFAYLSCFGVDDYSGGPPYVLCTEHSCSPKELEERERELLFFFSQDALLALLSIFFFEPQYVLRKAGEGKIARKEEFSWSLEAAVAKIEKNESSIALRTSRRRNTAGEIGRRDRYVTGMIQFGGGNHYTH